jgi:hypothetical protein
VVFTHRGFKDPRPGKSHTIGGFGESKWLKQAIEAFGSKRIITGHVHKSATLELGRIQQITAGQGLGYDDIVEMRQVSRILVGKVTNQNAVQYEWQRLNMPWRYHTSRTHRTKLKKDHLQKQLRWLNEKAPVDV